MIRISIGNDLLNINCLELKQLSRVLSWYNMTEEYCYATGIDEQVAMDAVGRRYFKVLQSEDEFFLGVHLNNVNEMIGLIRGRLSGRTVWINCLLIDVGYQKQGYGSAALQLLLEYFGDCGMANEVLLSVAQENRKGRTFWEKNGFREVQTVGEAAGQNGKSGKVHILKKTL